LTSPFYNGILSIATRNPKLISVDIQHMNFAKISSDANAIDIRVIMIAEQGNSYMRVGGLDSYGKKTMRK